MVTFYDIKVNNGVLTALALNEATGTTESITANLDGTYHSSSDSLVVKATWSLVVEYEKKGFPKEISVAWGQLLMIYESGALNPNSRLGMLRANELYEQIRKRRTDYVNVTRHTKFSLEQCKIVKNYIFLDNHELSVGYRRFFPDLAMAQSWLRLSEKDGNRILQHDVILLYHELTEISYLVRFSERTQAETHNKAEELYNYSEACKQYYSKLGIRL